MTFNISTLGCKVNTYESEFISSLFKRKGYSFASKNADIYIVNTCTVTNMADRKSRQVIHRIRRENPSSILVVCGCFSQNMYNNRKVEIDADIILGNKDKSKIVEYVEEYIKNKEHKEVFYDIRNQEFEDMEIDEEDRTRAFVKIEDGCNNFCSFCVIPYTRGKVRSKSKDKVISEITNLVNKGYKEIVLTGIHTGAYNDSGVDFASLLELIVKIKGLERLRISSIEINELNDRVLKVFEENECLVPHLHVPLQSGSDSILKKMNRKYDKEFFKNKIDYIRSIKKDINFTTDVIVGFPTESEKEHKESLAFIKEIGFSKIHVFPYSDREGTVASKMSDKVDPSIKKKRVNELIALSNELNREFLDKYIGKEKEILFEEYKNGYSYGHSDNYIKVKVTEEIKSGDLRIVKLTKDNMVIE